MTDQLDLDAMEGRFRRLKFHCERTDSHGAAADVANDALALIARVREVEEQRNAAWGSRDILLHKSEAERDAAIDAERKRCAEIARNDKFLQNPMDATPYYDGYDTACENIASTIESQTGCATTVSG